MALVNSLRILSAFSGLTPTISLLSLMPNNICPPFLLLKEHTVS
jgi:hypothetical protein